MSGTRELTSIVRRCRFFFSTLAMLTCFALPIWADAATLFVSDGNVDVIHRFDATTGAPILPDVSLQSVTGIAVGPNGDLFGINGNLPQVYRFDSTTGAPIGPNPFVTFTGQNDGHDVQGPGGMAFAPNGNLYIADVTLSNVHEYDTAGNSVASLGAANPSAFFSQPTDVAFDSNGNLFVVNPGNGSVLKSRSGT